MSENNKTYSWASPMSTGSFHRFIDQLGQLSKRQREKVMAHLDRTAKTEVVAGIIEKVSVEHLECPRCRGRDLYLHGRMVQVASNLANRITSVERISTYKIRIFHRAPYKISFSL